MNEPKKTEQVVRDFPGLMSNLSQHDLLPGGASEQVNVQSLQLGEAKVRGGIRECEFRS